MIRAGYLVMETCEDFEQALTLKTGNNFPTGGVLYWAEKNCRVVFQDRKSAMDAINRTEHYRLAFGIEQMPEKKFCHVVPVAFAPSCNKEAPSK